VLTGVIDGLCADRCNRQFESSGVLLVTVSQPCSDVTASAEFHIISLLEKVAEISVSVYRTATNKPNNLVNKKLKTTGSLLDKKPDRKLSVLAEEILDDIRQERTVNGRLRRRGF